MYKQICNSKMEVFLSKLFPFLSLQAKVKTVLGSVCSSSAQKYEQSYHIR